MKLNKTITHQDFSETITHQDFSVLLWREGKAYQVIIEEDSKTLLSHLLAGLDNGTIKIHADPVKGIKRGV